MLSVGENLLLERAKEKHILTRVDISSVMKINAEQFGTICVYANDSIVINKMSTPLRLHMPMARTEWKGDGMR